ncbi:MAG: hypothetical protein AB7U25_07180 [Vicinamibacterales bacterium]
MRPSDRHLDATTLRLLALDPVADSRAAAHLADCQRCRTAAERAERETAGLRAGATAVTDALFSSADLERQRRSILARIARGQRTARVLAFPAGDADAGPARPRADRRWLAAAAAAGLIFGALAGQLPHLGQPAARGPAERQAASPPAVEDVRAGGRPVDDTLLSEVEAALAPGSRPELRALDALTPVHYEMR